MKLHLPKCLFVALMSLFPLAAMAEDASTPPASYGKLITSQSLPTITIDNTLSYKPVNHTLISNASNTSWVLSLKASNLVPGDTQHISARTADILVFGNGRSTEVHNENKWYFHPQDGTLRLAIAPDCDLALAFNNLGNEDEETKILSNVKNYKWDFVSEVNVTLSYNATEKVLSLVSGSITRNADGKTVTLKPISDLGFVIPENFFAAGQLTYSGGLGSSLVSTLMTEGAEEGWRLLERTSLQDLRNGAYDGKALTDAHKVQFLGADAILYSTEDATFTNTVTTAVDMENLEEGIGMGFGAAAGKTLTVTTATNSINNAAGNALIDQLTIVGDGTVKLQYASGNTGNLSGLSVSIADAATLEINCADGAQINLSRGTFSSAASIVKTGGTDTTSSLILESGGVNTTLSKVSISNGTLQLINPGIINVDTVEARGAQLTGGIGVQAGTMTIGAGGLTIDPLSIAKVIGDLTINNGTLSSAGLLAVGQKITANSISATANGQIQAAEVVTNTITAAGITLNNGTGAPSTALKGNAYVGASGISADIIASGASIDFDNTSTGSVATKSLSLATISVGGTDTIATHASTDSSIAISKDALVATGKLSASSINLRGTYDLTAKELEASTLTDGDTSITGAGGSTNPYANIKDLAIYTDNTGARILSASNIDGQTVTIAGNTKLSDADITTTGGVTLKDGGTIQNASIEAGTSLVAGNNTKLDNVELSTQSGATFGDSSTLKDVIVSEGAFRSGQNTSLDNVTFVTDGTGNASTTTDFGGTNGNAVSVTNDVDSVQISGKLNGDNATIDKLVLNAEDLVFDTEGQATTYTFITGADIDYTYDAERDQINIASYVRAQLTTDAQGNIQVVGTRDTEGIKSELANTHNRRVAIKAIDEARASAPSSYAQTNATSTPLDAIYDYVGHVNRYSAAERQNVLSAVSGASTALLADSQRRGLRDVQDNLRNRIIQMGGGTNAGLITDWEYVGLQAWAQADGSLATTDGSGDEWGYDFNTSGATVGANIDLTANLVIGMSFSVSSGELDVDSTDNAKGNNDAQYVSFFARHNKERWVQMFIFTYGMNDMDMERSILGYNAKGDTKGTTLSAYYELGYTFGLDYEYTHILQPMVSISFTSASIDGYREEGSIGNAGIDYADNDYTYLQLAVGARYQGVLYETIHERNAVIEARALITQDFGDATNEAEVALAGSGQYTVKCADSSGTGFKLGAGVSIPVEQHTTLYADADFTYAPDYTGLRANIGVRYDF